MATLNEEELALMQEKMATAQLLKDRQFSWLSGLIRNELKVDKDSKNEDSLRKTTARTYLAIAGQLHGQIIKAASEGSLILALIGLRSLTECFINTKYIFDHPDHVGDNNWVDRLCKDLLELSHDKDAMKNQLDNKSIRERAEDITSADLNVIELYKNNFGYLSNFTHPNCITITVNDNELVKETTYTAIHNAICLAHDIGAAICNHFELEKNVELEKDIVRFRDECLKLAMQIK